MTQTRMNRPIWIVVTQSNKPRKKCHLLLLAVNDCVGKNHIAKRKTEEKNQFEKPQWHNDSYVCEKINLKCKENTFIYSFDQF